MAFPFLSDEWIDEARRIRAEYQDRAPGSPSPLRVNVVVTDVPWDPGRVEGYVDASSGAVDLEVGRLESPDVTVTLEHATARSLLVGADMQAAMAAFLGGRIRVDGDITKLIALQTDPGAVGPVVGEVIARLRSITE